MSIMAISLLVGLLSATVGGIVSGIDQIASDDAELASLNQELEHVKDQEKLDMENMRLEFKKNQDDANRKADEADLASTLQEGFLSNSVNASMEGLKDKQEADAYSFNYQAMANGQQTGDALSGMAASGLRGSSMSDAVDMQAAVNSQQLQLTEDQTRAGRKQDLYSTLNSLSQGTASIQSARTDAMNTRKAWATGGTNWTIYQNNKKMKQNDYNYKIDTLQGEYDSIKGSRAGRNWKAFFGGFANGYNAWGNLSSAAAKITGDKI